MATLFISGGTPQEIQEAFERFDGEHKVKRKVHKHKKEQD